MADANFTYWLNGVPITVALPTSSDGSGMEYWLDGAPVGYAEVQTVSPYFSITVNLLDSSTFDTHTGDNTKGIATWHRQIDYNREVPTVYRATDAYPQVGSSSGVNSGGIAKTRAISATGTANTSGSVARAISKYFLGTLSTAGVLSKNLARALSGNISFVGSLARSTNKFFSASLVLSANLSRSTAKALSASIVTTATLSRNVIRALVGILAPVGDLEHGSITHIGISGSLNTSGVLPATTFLLPVADLTNDGWTSTESTLYEAINEDSDSTYIMSPLDPSNSAVTVALQPSGEPAEGAITIFIRGYTT